MYWIIIPLPLVLCLLMCSQKSSNWCLRCRICYHIYLEIFLVAALWYALLLEVKVVSLTHPPTPIGLVFLIIVLSSHRADVWYVIFAINDLPWNISRSCHPATVTCPYYSEVKVVTPNPTTCSHWSWVSNCALKSSSRWQTVVMSSLLTVYLRLNISCGCPFDMPRLLEVIRSWPLTRIPSSIALLFVTVSSSLTLGVWDVICAKSLAFLKYFMCCYCYGTCPLYSRLRSWPNCEQSTTC